MILQLPIQFDGNERLITIVIVLEAILFFTLPKRFPTPITLLLLFFDAYLGRTVDEIIEFFPIDLYDSMDTSNYDLYDFFMYTFVYAYYGYFFAYFYDKWRLKGILQSVHIFAWSVSSTLFEAVASWFNVFRYKGWHLMYSSAAYLLIFSLRILLSGT